MRTRKQLATVAGLLAAAVVGAACGLGSSADGDGATLAESDNDNGAEQVDDSDDAPGTRQNPLAPGTAFEVGDWTIEFAATDTDADEIVAAENQFNDPPADGRQFVMVEVTVTYTGDDSGDPWIDLSINFNGSGGNTFGSSMDDYCGVIPNPLDGHGEMFPDATATGNVCASVPADQLEDGASWLVEDTWSVQSDRTFVAIG